MKLGLYPLGKPSWGRLDGHHIGVNVHKPGGIVYTNLGLEVIPLDTWLPLTEPLFYGVPLSSEFQIRTTLVSSIAVPTFPPDTWQDT